MTGDKRQRLRGQQDADAGRSDAEADVSGRALDMLAVEAFDPADVRPWRFHNRSESGMDNASLEALARSILRDGQQQLGLARRLPPGDTHGVEGIFGIRRLEACRRAGIAWRAEVRDESFSDAQCAALMHSENEWTEGISALENAVQWKAMLDAEVFRNRSALAVAIGCHRATVARAVRTATALFGEEWIARLVGPVMHQFTGRSADQLADALADPVQGRRAKRCAQSLAPGELSARRLVNVLLAKPSVVRETVYTRRAKGRVGGGAVAVKIERGASGGWGVQVRPHDQSAAEMAELAEKVEALLATEMAGASGVRLGRRLVSMLTPEEAKDANRAWLEGCIWAAARASGLEWDRWRCMGVAETLRNQRGGWERAVVDAVGGKGADPAGLPETV